MFPTLGPEKKPTDGPQARTLFSQDRSSKQQNPQEPVWGPFCPSVFLGAPSLPDQLAHSQDSW